MQDDLARIAVGLPVAAIWPLTVPYLAKSRLRVGSAAAISALYLLAPQIPSASSLLLLAVTTLLPLAFIPPGSKSATASDASWRQRLSAHSPIVAALLLGLVATALTDLDGARGALERWWTAPASPSPAPD